jgi:hypothetical protein
VLNSKRRQELIDAITAHFHITGRQEWRLVMAKFPDVSRATFWSHVASVRDGVQPPAAKPDPAPLTPQSVLAEIEAAAGPATPHYADMAFELLRGHPKRLYAIQRLQQLASEAEELTIRSMGKFGRIRNAVMYASSIKLRQKLLFDELSAIDGLVDDTAPQKSFDMVLESIAAESPETRDKILAL